MSVQSPSTSNLGSVSAKGESAFASAPLIRHWRQGLVLGLKLLVSGSIILYLIRTQRLGMDRLRGVWQSPVQLSMALGLLFLLPFLLTLRWQILLRALEHRLPFRGLLSMTFMVVFLDTIMPGGAADIIRGYYLDRNFRLDHRARALSTVVVDRFLGVMGLVLAALVALALKSHSALGGSTLQSLEVGTTFVGTAFLLVFLFLGSRKNIGRGALERLCSRVHILKPLLGIYDAFRGYADRTPVLLKALSLSLLGNVFTIVSVLLLGSAVGESHLRIADYFCLVPVGLFVAQVPISPGGIGIGHLGFYSLFLMAGSRLGAEIFSLFIVVRFVSSIPGFFCFLLTRQQTRSECVTNIETTDSKSSLVRGFAPLAAQTVTDTVQPVPSGPARSKILASDFEAR